MKRLISFALFGLTVGTLWSLARQLQGAGRRDRYAAKPEPVQTWEGEGGALPATGAQMGPDPAVQQANPNTVERPGEPGMVH